MKSIMTLLLSFASLTSAGELMGPPEPPDKWTLIEMGNPSTSKDVFVDVAWLGGAAAFDVVTTHYALNTCTGCYEANGFFRADDGFQQGKAIAGKLLVTGGVTFACYKLRKSGHRTAAKILRWSVVGLWVVAGGVNVSHIQ